MSKQNDNEACGCTRDSDVYITNIKESIDRSSWTSKLIAGAADLAVGGTDVQEYTNPAIDMNRSTLQNDVLSSEDIGVVTVPFISNAATTLTDNVDQNAENNKDEGCCLCLGRWWNSHYRCQRRIMEVVEKPWFHMLIVVLVLVDCLLVIAELMFDLIKLRKPCHSKNIHSTKSHHEENHQLELIIEILDYSSLTLLILFLIEVIVKVYAFGRQWWDFHRQKMEWLDAIIVIISLVVDIWLMNKTNLIAEISLLFISIRLWRFIRIVNSLAQSIRSEDETKKVHLAITYVQVVELLLTISEKKTNTVAELRQQKEPESLDSIIEQFSKLDQMCRHIIEHCPRPSSLNTVTDISHRLHDAMEQARLTSSTMSASKKNDHQ